MLLYVQKIYSLFESILNDLNNNKKTNVFEIIDYDCNDLIMTINDFINVYNKETINEIFNLKKYNDVELQNHYKKYKEKLYNSLINLNLFIYKLDDNQGILLFYDEEKYETLFNKFDILIQINEFRNSTNEVINKNTNLKKTENINNKNFECKVLDLDILNTVSNDITECYGFNFLKKTYKYPIEIIKFSFIIDEYNLNQEVDNLIISMNELEKIAKDIDNNNHNMFNTSISNDMNSNELKYKNAVDKFLNCVENFFKSIYSKNGLSKNKSFKDYGVLLAINILKNKFDTKNNYKEKVNYVFKRLLNANLKEKEKNNIYEIYCNKKNTYSDLIKYIQILDIGYRFFDFEFPNNKLNILYFNENITNDIKFKITQYITLIKLLNDYFNTKIEKKIIDTIIEFIIITKFTYSVIEKFFPSYIFTIMDFKEFQLRQLFSKVETINNLSTEKKEYIFIWFINDILKILASKIIFENNIILNYFQNNKNVSDSLKKSIELIYKIYYTNHI